MVELRDEVDICRFIGVREVEEVMDAGVLSGIETRLNGLMARCDRFRKVRLVRRGDDGMMGGGNRMTVWYWGLESTLDDLIENR